MSTYTQPREVRIPIEHLAHVRAVVVEECDLHAEEARCATMDADREDAAKWTAEYERVLQRLDAEMVLGHPPREAGTLVDWLHDAAREALDESNYARVLSLVAVLRQMDDE